MVIVKHKLHLTSFCWKYNYHCPWGDQVLQRPGDLVVIPDTSFGPLSIAGYGKKKSVPLQSQGDVRICSQRTVPPAGSIVFLAPGLASVLSPNFPGKPGSQGPTETRNACHPAGYHILFCLKKSLKKNS